MSRRKPRNYEGKFTTPVVGFESWAQMQARVKREELEAAAKAKSDAEASFLALQAETNTALRGLRDLRRETLFTDPSPELANLPQRPAVIEGVTSDAIAQQILAAAEGAFKGITLTASGRSKVIRVLHANQTLDTRKVEVWAAVRDLMLELGILLPEDGVGGSPEPTVTPSPVASPAKQTIDEVLATNSSLSREGYRKIKSIVDRDAYQEWADTFSTFVQACHDQFEPLTQDECNALGRMIMARNLNPRLLHSWSQARELCVRAGYLRPIFLTPDEALAWDVERGIVKTDTFDQRQEFNRRVSAIHGGTPLLQ